MTVTEGLVKDKARDIQWLRWSSAPILRRAALAVPRVKRTRLACRAVNLYSQ